MRRILVVDDSPLLQSMFKLTLRSLPDCEVTFAKHGLEALDQIAQNGEPQLILLDINMPVMDGLEFMHELERTGVKDRVPVVIISTEGKEEDVLRGLEAGAKAYLRKPFAPHELRDLLERVMVQ